MATTLHATTLATPAGPFTLLTDRDAVVAAGFTADTAALRHLLPAGLAVAPVVEARSHGDAARAFTAYFTGDLGALGTVRVTAGGTAHQEATWTALRGVRAGEPVTYAQLAARVGSGARATGSACGRNPTSVVVPCHRVVRADGGLGGYLWGTAAKRWLLDHEQRHAGEVTPASPPPRPHVRGRTPAAARRS